jgi:hypothetical protein
MVWIYYLLFLLKYFTGFRWGMFILGICIITINGILFGVQNQALSLYTEASKLPNCVTLNSKKDAQKFRDACNFILQHKPIQQLSVQASNQTASTTVEPKHEDIFEMIEKLAALKERNIITEEEFESKKMELLKRL